MPQQKIEDNNVFVGSMYGAHTKKGMVQIQIDSFKVQWSILEARKVAHMILEAAQGAETDEAVFEFFNNMPGDKEQSLVMAAMIVQEIRKKHNRNDQRIFEN